MMCVSEGIRLNWRCERAGQHTWRAWMRCEDRAEAQVDVLAYGGISAAVTPSNDPGEALSAAIQTAKRHAYRAGVTWEDLALITDREELGPELFALVVTNAAHLGWRAEHREDTGMRIRHDWHYERGHRPE